MNLKNLVFCKKKIALCISVFAIIVVVITTMCAVININNKTNDAIETLFTFDNVRDDEVYDAYYYVCNKKSFTDKIILEISTRDDFDDVIKLAQVLNDKEYDDDGSVKAAIIDRIEKEVSNCNIAEELALYVALEDAEPWHYSNANYNEKFVYANINDIISKEDLIEKIENNLIKTDIKDYSSNQSSSSKDYVSKYIPTEDGLMLEWDRTTTTKCFLYYKGQKLFDTTVLKNAEYEREEDFRFIASTLLDYSDTSTILTFFDDNYKHSTVVFYDTTVDCIYTSKGTIKYDKVD